MTTIKLPTWEEVKARREAGEATALDEFIFEQTPGGSEAEQVFNDTLRAALEQVVADALAARPAWLLTPVRVRAGEGEYSAPVQAGAVLDALRVVAEKRSAMCGASGDLVIASGEDDIFSPADWTAADLEAALIAEGVMPARPEDAT